MARTRTLQPARARALHYAAIRKQRHAKPVVYACSHFLVRVALLVCATAPGAMAQPRASAPCLACQAFSAEPQQIGLLPARLQGTRVLVRVAPAAAPETVAAAIAEIARRGGKPGLHVTGIPTEGAAMLTPDVNRPGLPGALDMLDVFIIDVPAGDPDQQAFALKHVLTRVRGAPPSMRLMTAATAATLDSLNARGLGPYIDGAVDPARPVGRAA